MAANWVEIAAVDYVIKVVICIMLFVPLYGVLLNTILRVMAGRQNATA